MKRRPWMSTVRLVVGVPARLVTANLQRRRDVLAAFGKVEALDGGTFLVVVPGFDHDERQRMSRIEVTVVQVQRVFESLAAARSACADSVPILRQNRQSPARRRPRRSCRDACCACSCRSHPDTARPNCFHRESSPFVPAAPRHTGPRNRARYFCWRLVFIEKDMGDDSHRLAVLNDAVPVDVAMLGENENHRMAVIGQISAAMRSLRTDVGAVGFVHRGHGVIGGLRVFVGGFVVEKRDLKMTLVGSLLHQGEIVIGKGLALAVPVHHESGDAHVARLLDLVAQYIRDHS